MSQRPRTPSSTTVAIVKQSKEVEALIQQLKGDEFSYLDMIYRLQLLTFNKVMKETPTAEFDREWYSIRQIFDFPTVYDLEAWLYVKKHLIAERIWTKQEIDNFEVTVTLGWDR